MASYDLVERLNNTFRQIELELQALQQALSDCRLLAGRVFELPAIGKDAEHDPLATIPVVQHIGKTALARALRHYSHLFIQQQSENRSSKAAVRLPGAICLQVTAAEQQDLLARIQHINALKATFEKIVTVDSGLPPTARFEWVHRHLPGLITLSAYRTLTPLVDPSTIRFGWANKHVIKNLTRDQVLMMLEKKPASAAGSAAVDQGAVAEQTGKGVSGYRRPAAAGAAENKTTGESPADRPRLVRRRAETGTVRLPQPPDRPDVRQPGVSVPDIGELLNYDADNVQYRYKPEAQSLRLLIPRLHLWLASE